MPNNRTPININVNFSGVSYDPNSQTWSGTPTWNVNPDPANVPPSKSGNTMTLQFNLNAAAVPNPFTAAFAANGIAFKNGWSGGPPSTTNSTTISMDDTFNDLTSAQDYPYSVNVVLSGLVGANEYVTHTFTLDPDVENEAGQANLVIARKPMMPAV